MFSELVIKLQEATSNQTHNKPHSFRPFLVNAHFHSAFDVSEIVVHITQLIFYVQLHLLEHRKQKHTHSVLALTWNSVKSNVC